MVPKIFVFDEEEVPAELRAQRRLNKTRIPELSQYLTEQLDQYTLSAITASVNRKVNFDAFSDTGPGQDMGTLSIPIDAQILIND